MITKDKFNIFQVACLFLLTHLSQEKDTPLFEDQIKYSSQYCEQEMFFLKYIWTLR